MWIIKLSQSNKPTIVGYAAALFSVALAFFVLSVMRPQFSAAPTPLFLCAIMFTAWVGGTGPCFFSIVLSVLAYDYFFVTPLHSFVINGRHSFRILFFSMAAIFIGGLAAAQQSAVRSAKRASDKLALAIDDLKSVNLKLEMENTERNRIHESLRYSEAFLTEGQKISRTGSWRWNIEVHSLEWSDEHYRIFGYEPSSDMSCFEMYSSRAHPTDHLLLANVVKEAVAKKQRFECDYRIILSAGSIRFLRGIGMPVFSRNDHFEGYIGVTVDITAQRQAEDSLRKSEQEFRTLAENSPDGVIRYDRDCKRIYVNPAHLRNMGVEYDDAVNVTLDSYWGADMTVDEYRAILRSVMTTGQPAEVSGRWTRPDGGIVFFAVHAVAEFDSKGEAESVLAISRNITSIIEAENQLRQSQKLLRQLADRSETSIEDERKHIARELHDDLAQHLSALRMNVSVMKLEFGHLSSAFSGQAETMIERLDATIKIARNVITALRPTALDMGIVQALEWLVKDFSTHKEISCRLHIHDENLILSDRSATAIFRIAQESLRNISRHAEACNVDVNLSHKDGMCLLAIRDDGRGFNTTNVPFNSFGLMGIKERVLILGGKVEIESEEGQGTTIRVNIPTTE
ncbi:sensory box histidine kinase [Janthinobacterium sp. Marseille]|nr:sensory box histidine kinase [Janthinobacterium sp. Marseille]